MSQDDSQKQDIERHDREHGSMERQSEENDGDACDGMRKAFLLIRKGKQKIAQEEKRLHRARPPHPVRLAENTLVEAEKRVREKSSPVPEKSSGECKHENKSGELQRQIKDPENHKVL